MVSGWKEPKPASRAGPLSRRNKGLMALVLLLPRGTSCRPRGSSPDTAAHHCLPRSLPSFLTHFFFSSSRHRQTSLRRPHFSQVFFHENPQALRVLYKFKAANSSQVWRGGTFPSALPAQPGSPELIYNVSSVKAPDFSGLPLLSLSPKTDVCALHP